jgi:protein-tyrosine phosphatase
MASSDLRIQLPVLATSLAEGESVMIHCAAGIHRTGMVAYALLRLNGYEPEESFEALADMRVVTREGVGQERLSWVEQLIHDLSD